MDDWQAWGRERPGLVHATYVRTRGLGGQFAAALRSLIGGEVSAYVSEVERARTECLSRLVSKAQRMGANAVVGVDFETTEMLQGSFMVNAWGLLWRLSQRSRSWPNSLQETQRR